MKRITQNHIIKARQEMKHLYGDQADRLIYNLGERCGFSAKLLEHIAYDELQPQETRVGAIAALGLKHINNSEGEL